jgi:hypothetical protein
MIASPHLLVVQSHPSWTTLQTSPQENFSEREEGIAPTIFELETLWAANKGNKVCLANPWKAWETCSIHNVTYNEGQEPNTSKSSTQDDN